MLVLTMIVVIALTACPWYINSDSYVDYAL